MLACWPALPGAQVAGLEEERGEDGPEGIRQLGPVGWRLGGGYYQTLTIRKRRCSKGGRGQVDASKHAS